MNENSDENNIKQANLIVSGSSKDESEDARNLKVSIYYTEEINSNNEPKTYII